ncbi:MAG: hypothetical protein U9O95_09110 [Candidatus Marinimicrobia bacterium]|nr:hypothetical protein [Candidatus Neomarinimicrobiota bacterium]
MRKLTMAKVVGLAVLLLFIGSGILLANDYVPLKEGLSRTYSIGGAVTKTVEDFEERKLGKKKVVPQKIVINGSTSFIFIRETKKGQILFAIQGAEDSEPVILEELVYLNKNPFKTGTTWEGDFTTSVMMESVTFPLTYEIQKGKETVTVPAGTFDKCLKVVAKGEVERDKGLLGMVKITIVQTDWYAPKVGLIKSVLHKSGNHVLIQEDETITQLTGYKK